MKIDSLGKIRYVGEGFGANSLTDNKIYDVIGINGDDMFLVVDDSSEAYLYSITNPAPLDGENIGGVWELIEDYSGKLSSYLQSLIMLDKSKKFILDGSFEDNVITSKIWSESLSKEELELVTSDKLAYLDK